MSNSDNLKLNYDELMDDRSFYLGDFNGVLFAFSEMVLRMEKPLAFSKPFKAEDEKSLRPFVEKHTCDFGLKYYLEKDILLTHLFKSVNMNGRWVYIIYRYDKDLNKYFDLKKEEFELKKEKGGYDNLKELSLRYATLMGYKSSSAQELINSETVSEL